MASALALNAGIWTNDNDFLGTAIVDYSRGKPITDADIERMADEAEAGHDTTTREIIREAPRRFLHVA